MAILGYFSYSVDNISHAGPTKSATSLNVLVFPAGGELTGRGQSLRFATHGSKSVTGKDRSSEERRVSKGETRENGGRGKKEESSGSKNTIKMIW